jgi:hypothetical protein
MDKDAGIAGGNQSPSQSGLDVDRRETLRRLARFSAYTAPVLLAMLASEKALAVT